MTNQTFYICKKTTSCSGGDSFGHPLVYINISKEDKAYCPYCGKLFVYRENSNCND